VALYPGAAQNRGAAKILTHAERLLLAQGAVGAGEKLDFDLRCLNTDLIQSMLVGGFCAEAGFGLRGLSGEDLHLLARNPFVPNGALLRNAERLADAIQHMQHSPGAPKFREPRFFSVRKPRHTDA
jgi:hypothetical protein